MFKTLKEYNKYKKLINKDQRFDDDGRVIIDITVNDDSNFLSPYSYSENNDISTEVASFIDQSILSIKKGQKIHFVIHSDSIDDNEKIIYKKAIHNHYKDCYINSYIERKRLTKISIIMLLIGMFALGLMIYFNVSHIISEVFSEVIDIFAWVFIWEAVDIFFFQVTTIKYKQLRYYEIANSIIKYKKINNGE